MKRLPQILLCLFPYLFVFLFFSNISLEEGTGVVCTWLPNMILGAIILLNIVNGVIMCKRKESLRTVSFWNLVIKLAHIPFYFIIFIIGILSGLLGLIPVPFMIFVGAGIVISLVVLDYMMLVISSIYGIAAINIGKYHGIFSRTEAMWYVILHFIFCADVVIAAIIYGRARNCISK